MNNRLPGWNGALSLAKEFVGSSLPYHFTFEESEIIFRFFTNINGRVFFLHSLPENMISVLMAMYSRLKNTRGIRGIFVDSFLPQVFTTLLPEYQRIADGDSKYGPDKYLRDRKIFSLDGFAAMSEEARGAFEEFRQKIFIDSEYLKRLVSSAKISAFLNTWLEAYGHNSIARPATYHICFEGISILAAKSIEWCRPGSGYIELSTRYVDMAGKDTYPAAKELACFGIPEIEVARITDLSFKLYRDFQGDDFSGPFPQFLEKTYGKIVPADKLRQGIIGETCDVLGNFLPASTLTSLGASVSGEALTPLIQHLWLDDTPENFAIAELIMSEGEKVGANQFFRHLELTDWQEIGWCSLDDRSFMGRFGRGPIHNVFFPAEKWARETLVEIFKHEVGHSQSSAIEDHMPKQARGEYDKLPREFEAVSGSFLGVMSFRGWRDLHRMGFASHKRGYLTPSLGFYLYTKPMPAELNKGFADISFVNRVFSYNRASVPSAMLQYPMALGNNIPFFFAANLREFEFCNWQRTKPTVNHEVREVFLAFEKETRRIYPWWEKISRADMTPAYVFARGGSDISLPKELYTG